MHLVGQHSNPSELLEAVLGWVPDASGGARRELTAALTATKRLGNGVVKRALIKYPFDKQRSASPGTGPWPRQPADWAAVRRANVPSQAPPPACAPADL